MTSKSAEFPAIMASPIVNVELRTTPFLGPRYARRNVIWAILETIYQNNRRALSALDRTGPFRLRRKEMRHTRRGGRRSTLSQSRGPSRCRRGVMHPPKCGYSWRRVVRDRTAPRSPPLRGPAARRQHLDVWGVLTRPTRAAR
jgi:hypothetical protein